MVEGIGAVEMSEEVWRVMIVGVDVTEFMKWGVCRALIMW